MSVSIIPAQPVEALTVKPWTLPKTGLAVYYGCEQALRLFHYFLPGVLFAHKQILCLDGANRFDPLLLARFARSREIDPAEFNARVRVARAFTCFQLTELLVRAPRMLETFPAATVIVTALPDLYFDEDVREPAAQAAFAAALRALKRLAAQPVAVGVFTEAEKQNWPQRHRAHRVIREKPKTGFNFKYQIPRMDAGQKGRRPFFAQLLAAADWVWRMGEDEDGRMQMVCEKEVRRLASAERTLLQENYEA